MSRRRVECPTCEGAGEVVHDHGRSFGAALRGLRSQLEELDGRTDDDENPYLRRLGAFIEMARLVVQNAEMDGVISLVEASE